MFRNYCKIALRNLFRNKVYSFINISGLAIGMAVALLIGLWVWDEMSFDHVHSRHARLGRILDSQKENGRFNTHGSVDVPLEAELRTKYASDFKHMAMAGGFEPHQVTVADKKIHATGIGCEHELPGMLTLHMLRGDIDALKDPSSTLIAASLAKSLFGDTDPIGRTMQVDDKFQLTIAGVYEDLPANAQFHNAYYFIPWERHVDTHIWIRNVENRWGENFVALYVELAENADFDKVSARIRHIPSEHILNSEDELLVHPMDKWHLYNEFKDRKASTGRIQFIWLFGTIAAFVLLLACINFMNLSTARSEKRALEVGIRKTMGSLRSHLIGQFLGESVITACLSLVLAILLMQLLLPVFNHLSEKTLKLPWDQPMFWLSALAFTIFTGLISGCYPAFYLSRFQPVKVLKGAIRSGRLAQNFVGAASTRSFLVRNLRSPRLSRQVLVVVQFTVSVVLIIGTLVVYNQIKFAKARPLGYDKNGLVTVNLLNNPGLKPKFNALRHDLLSSGMVVDVAGGSGSTTMTWMTRGGYNWQGKDPNTNPFFGHAAVTHDFGNTARWQIVEGRDFTRTLATDSGAIILNESAVKLAGLKNPIGKTITFDNPWPHPIIGVVKDMVTDSPYDPATPTIFFIDYNWINFITLRLNTLVPANKAMTTVQNIFKQYDPQGLVSFEFTDLKLDFKFAGEERIGSIATFFTILAVLISCLGLFGLASFVAEQRTREIGIRKVLGATIYNVWSTLSKDFVVLVLIACAIAIPFSVYLLHGWLQRFPYRTTVSWQLCTGAVAGAVALTLITVSYQTLRAAVANPAKSLRTE